MTTDPSAGRIRPDEPRRAFHITSAMDNMQEWLIVWDTGPCVTVVSAYEPHIREFG